jgi:hypothetical protein
VEDQFFDKVKDLEEVIGQSGMNCLMGVNPSYA